MKASTFAVAALAVAQSALAAPEITSLSVTQNSSKVVTIDFTLSEKAILTMDFTTNGVSIGAENYRGVHDAQSDSMEYPANKVVSAGRHVFMWRSSREWPGYVFNNGEFAVNLKAWRLDSPPDYMVVDLATKSNRWFYASAADLPDGGIKTADPDDPEAVADLTNDVYRTTKLVMRRIPAAGNKWRMGSPTTETQWRSGTEVLHYVTLTEDYYIGIYPLTKWQAVAYGAVANTPDTIPVNNLSYEFFRGTPTVSDYNWPDNGHEVSPSSAIGKLRAYTGVAFDFPTEAQWEYACRAGTSGAFNDGTINYSTEPNALGWGFENSGKTIMPVGLLKPNAWGLYDMHGNVWEWCLDQFQTHPSTPQVDPEGATTNMPKRVVKGGTCTSSLVVGRSAARLGPSSSAGYETSYSGFMGIRLCCPISGAAE